MILWKQHKQVMADLNEAIKWPRNDARLNRIKGRVKRGDREGKFFEMGDNIAREIERALNLPEGWMDTPPTYAELLGQEDPQAKIMMLMEQMSPEMQRLFAQLGDTMVKQPIFSPPPQLTNSRKNGTQ